MPDVDQPASGPSAGPTMLLAQVFNADGVGSARHAVAQHATAAGLRGNRLDDFVLALNELMTNAVRHGGGQGWLRLWCFDEIVYGEVTDHGPGIPGNRMNTPRPADFTVGGRGLWLARQLCDMITFRTGTAGTTVRIGTALSDLPAAAEEATAALPEPA